MKEGGVAVLGGKKKKWRAEGGGNWLNVVYIWRDAYLHLPCTVFALSPRAPKLDVASGSVFSAAGSCDHDPCVQSLSRSSRQPSVVWLHYHTQLA